MRLPDNKQIVKPSLTLYILLVVFFAAVWALNYIFIPESPEGIENSIPLLGTGKAMRLGIILLISAFNLYLIAQINNRFSIIRIRTFVPVLIYALLITSWNKTHLSLSPHLTLTVFIFCLMIFLRMYKDKKAVGNAFAGSLLLSLTVFSDPALLLFLPVTWLGFITMKCFSSRVFLASLAGALIPWIYYVCFCLFTGTDMSIITTGIPDAFQINIIFSRFNLYDKIYIAAMFLIMIAGIAGMFGNRLSDSIQTRKNLNVILLYLIAAVLFLLLFAQHSASFLPITAFCMALLLAHPFSLNKYGFFPVLFILFFIIHIAYMYFNIFMI